MKRIRSIVTLLALVIIPIFIFRRFLSWIGGRLKPRYAQAG